MTITVIWLPGTGFSSGPDGVSQVFADALDRDRFQFRCLNYPADYGARMSYASSRAQGRVALIDAARQSSGPVVLGGYSQGAGIAGDLAAEFGAYGPRYLEQHRLPPIVGCALIADPSRPAGAGMPGRPVASGYGIVGARDIAPWMRTWWAAAEGDPITSLPAGNPLRAVADVTKYFSMRSPGDAHRWMTSLLERVRAGRWQRWHSLENWRTWPGAVAYARGYLVDGRHTLDYIRYGHAQELAQVVNDYVGEVP